MSSNREGGEGGKRLPHFSSHVEGARASYSCEGSPQLNEAPTGRDEGLENWRLEPHVQNATLKSAHRGDTALADEGASERPRACARSCVDSSQSETLTKTTERWG